MTPRLRRIGVLLAVLGFFTLPGVVLAAIVSGTVSAVGVGPIAGVEVQFLAAGSAMIVAGDVSMPQTGTYAVNVPNGLYDVRVVPPQDSIYSPRILPGYSVDTNEQLLDIVIGPGTGAIYSGVVTEDGIAKPDVNVNLDDLQGRSVVSSFTDASGRFSMTAPPGTYTRSLSYYSSAPPCYQAYQLRVDGLLELPADENFDLEGARRRVLTVTVVDPEANPVPNAIVSMPFGGNATPFGPFQYVSQFAQCPTDASGQFAFPIYPGDSQTVQAAPPPESGLGLGRVDVSVTDDTDVTITLPPAPPSVEYGATIATDGTAIADAGMGLCDTQQCLQSPPTDASGSFTMTVPEGLYSRYVYFNTSTSVPPFKYQSYTFLVSGVIELPPPLHENFDVDGMRRKLLKGTVLDPDGNPLPFLSIGLNMTMVPFASFDFGYESGSLLTDASGRFEFQVYPGAGSVSVSPFGGLLPVLIDVAIADRDRTLAIFLQFPADLADCPATQPGGQCSTGLNPTSDDPIETTVTTPTDGITRSIKIEEQPIAQAAPRGFRFLTQQVHVDASPAASAGQPFRIVFAFDATRIPVGQDETRLALFKDGFLVPPCSGAPDQAAPDPCVALRERRPDGDVALTVLTSTASIWNIGERLPDHFLCYKTSDSKGDICAASSESAGAPCGTEEDCGGTTGVTAMCVANKLPKGLRTFVADRLSAGLLDVKKALDLCNPADTNGAGIGDPETHLRAYQVQLAKTAPKQPKFESVRGLRIENEMHPLLGSLTLDAVKLDRLMLPAAKSLEAPIPPPDLATPRIDHYACYKTKLSKGTEKFPKGIQLSAIDQFGQPKRYDVGSPLHLCVPASKNGAPVLRPEHHLVCYEIKPAKGEPKHQKVHHIFVDDEFLPAIVDTTGEEELCVPSRVS